MGAQTPTDALGVTQAMSTEDANDSKSGEHECPECPRSFDARRGLTNHFHATHGGSLVQYELKQSDDSAECPTCGEWLPSDSGMKIHHTKVHGESIAGVPVYCSQCGEQTDRMSEAHRDRIEHHFCGRRCHSDYENGGRIAREYGVSPGGLLHTLHWDRQMSANAISDLFDVHHIQICRWMDYRGVERRSQSEAELLKREQMTPEQRVAQVAAAHEATRGMVEAGEHHWQLDNPDHEGYGAGWTDKKKEAVREMYGRTCQGCGDPEKKHVEKYGRRLDVHHIIPAGYFDDPQKRNAIGNLVPLCYPCHTRWEGIPLRPQLAD